MRTSMRTHRTRAAVAAAALLALTACGNGSDASADKDTSASASASPSTDAASSTDASPAAGGPDLTAIPDVVAEVNGEEITKDEFAPIFTAVYTQAKAAAAQSGGAAPDEKELRTRTLDDLVTTELLAQEAESRDIEVSDADVDAELTSLAEQNGLSSAEEFLAAIEQQGLTADQARDQIETETLIERLVIDEDGSITPTAQELRARYDQAAKQSGGADVPPFAQVRDQLSEQMEAERVGTVARRLAKGLRADADITLNL